ncbi:acetyl-CoA carboxylase biotin carboxyl carrier protein [Peptococcus simiae]|uniref:acetyl-CoA carboxylase biotin carboxyl carrier protein n=1 Tax=Peptococcus simiae TaxID=1643805 RepID=UPI00397FE291
MTIDEIERLLRAFDRSGVAQLTVKTADGTVKLNKAPLVQVATPGPQGASPAPGAASEVPCPVEEEPDFATVEAPLAGTFYAAPAEDADAFVRVGDHIEVGQTIGIIEAMKVMNDIPSTVSGRVVAILPTNGSVIGYHDVILQVEADV